MLAARVVTFGAAAVTILALVSSGGTASAQPIVPGGSTGSGFTLSSSGTGLNISLFGTQLTGGSSSASVSYTAANPTATPATAQQESSTASGQAVFLTTQGLAKAVSASATYGGTDSSGSATPSCDQSQGGGSSGVGINLSVACAAALATTDPATDGPQALGGAYVAQLTVDISGVLNQLGLGGLDQLCSALGQIPTLGSIVLGPACTDIFASVTPTVTVTLGKSVSQITTSATELEAQDSSSSIDIQLFPVKLAGGNTEPLLEVTIPSAIATTTYTAAAGWSNTYDSTLIRVSGLLVDALNTASGGSFPDPLEIPPNNSGTSQLAALNSSPLGQILTIDLADGTTSGSSTTGGSATAEGLKVNVLGGVSQAMGGINVDTSGVTTSGSTGPSTGANQSTPTTVPPASQPGNSPAVPTVAAATSPTAVHTGEWWSGSLPLIALLVAAGGALIGWPRLRRFAVVSRTRSGR